MPRPTKLQIAAKRAEDAGLALDAAKKAYREAHAEYLRQSHRSARRPRHEYAVLLIDEHGDSHNTCFADTLADARKEAVRWIGSEEGDGTVIVGTVIERFRIDDLQDRTTVETHGKVTPEWIDAQHP